MPSLSAFIRGNIEPILMEWEAFARQLPMGASMDVSALRDHAKEMLRVVADDLEEPQTEHEQSDKAKGASDRDQRQSPTAAGEHGSGRAESGFTVEQMVAEFRALRASVIRLWTNDQGNAGPTELDELIRFNEAIDQAITESLLHYTHDVERTKERFLAILGHDLRTPLGAIITSSQFMLDTGGLSESHLKLVGGISSAGRRMSEMVGDLLDFARTRFGDTIPISREEMDVGTMVRDAAAEVAASHPNTPIEIETDGNLVGEWDCARLAQAVTNLLSNSVQHGPHAPIKLAAHGASNEIVISVQNHGPAIPADDVGRIFDAMTQGVKEKRDRRHLGLGLYIVEKIVTAHGGSVDVQSSAEATTFSLHLPRVPAGRRDAVSVSATTASPAALSAI